MIECVVFDLDDTLYPEIQYVESGFLAVAPVLSCWLGLSKEQVIFELWEEFHHDRSRVFDSLLKRYGFWESGKASLLITLYRSHLPRLKLFPDAEEILTWLNQKPVKIGILTDGYVFVQRQKIRALRLEYWMDEIIYTDMLGREFWKPHIRPFEILLEKLKCLPSRTVYVGDNPLKDFYGARQAGIHTIHIKRANGFYSEVNVPPGYEADLTVYSLLDIKSYVNIP